MAGAKVSSRSISARCASERALRSGCNVFVVELVTGCVSVALKDGAKGAGMMGRDMVGAQSVHSDIGTDKKAGAAAVCLAL